MYREGDLAESYDNDDGYTGDLSGEDWHYYDILEAGENIADEISDTARTNIGLDVKTEYELDEESRSDVVMAYDAAMKAARAEKTVKNWPFAKASSVRYPLLTVSTNQFAARAYPAIVNGSEVVKARVLGDDPDGMKQKRASRISEHMSYQCIEQMPEWEKQFDEMLHHLPLAGCLLYTSPSPRD